MARLKAARSHAEMSEWVGREECLGLGGGIWVVMDVSKEGFRASKIRSGYCGSKVL